MTRVKRAALEAQVGGLRERLAQLGTVPAQLSVSSDELHALHDQVSDYAVFLLDRQGKVTSWNSGAERIYGYRAEEIIDQEHSCFYTREDIAAGAPALLLERAAAKGRGEAEGWRVRKDGACFWASGVVQALAAEDGSLRGFVRITRDLSQRRAGEEALQRSLWQQTLLASGNAALCEKLKGLQRGSFRALSATLSVKDAYTLGHAARVAVYMALLGHELGWSADLLVQVQEAGYLHDIGKIGVSDRVLLKAGPLSSEEWELIRQHPAISADIVEPLFDTELLLGVRHHHERFDGGGYPDGLAGRAIPPVARAMCVVDCYDAMSYERPYRRALTYKECLAELRRCSGTQFDPEMMSAFLTVLARLEERRRFAAGVAEQAAALIDPDKHALLRSPADETRPEYKEMVLALRRLRDANPPLRFICSYAKLAERYVYVLDAEEETGEISHIGDECLGERELAKLFAGHEFSANTLYADEFGVWVSGMAAIRARKGGVVAVVSADIAALETAGLHGSRSDFAQTPAALWHAAAARHSRADLQATTDGLTGLPNHCHLHEHLEKEIARAAGQKGTLCLLFVDVDEFKAYNGTHGYKIGDEALLRLARILGAATRHADLAARYTGEEFVVLLPGSDPVGALEVAERIRAQVAAPDADDLPPLTVSIGIATCPQDAHTGNELLETARWAAEMAKRGGGDRVVSAAAACELAPFSVAATG